MSSVPFPVGINFSYWAAIMREQFAGSVPQLGNPDAWQTWARCVVSSAQFSGMDLPRPEGYATPIAWAMDFWRAYDGGT